VRAVLVALLVLAAPLAGCLDALQGSSTPSGTRDGGSVSIALGSDPRHVARLAAGLRGLDPTTWTTPTTLVLAVTDASGASVLLQKVAIGETAAHVHFTPGPAAFEGLGAGYEIRLAGGLVSQNASGTVTVARDETPEPPATQLARVLGRAGGLGLLGSGIDPLQNLSRLTIVPCGTDCLEWRSVAPTFFGVVGTKSRGQAWFEDDRIVRLENRVNLSSPSPVRHLLVDILVGDGTEELPAPHAAPRAPLAVPVLHSTSPGDLQVLVAEDAWMDGRLDDLTLVVLEGDREVLALPLANGTGSVAGEAGMLAFTDEGRASLLDARDLLSFTTSAAAESVVRHLALRDAWAGGAYVLWRDADGAVADRLRVP